MRNVVVTGGSRGIGAAIVERFTKEGDRVWFFYETQEELAAQVAARTGAVAIQCDVADEGQVAAAFAQIPQVDVLINNAGVADYNPINWVEPARFRRILDVNVTGAYLCIRAALPAMLKTHQGAIVNLASMWGQVGASCEAAYSASKAAVIGLTKALAKELGPSGIRVNAAAPGVILTDMVKNVAPAVLDEMRLETPLERLGQPEDVANAVWYLASQQASFVTGAVLNVGGGYVM